MRRILREVGTYGLASAAGLVTDAALLTLLVSVMHVHFMTAAAISFLCGGLVVYALSVTFVFRFRRLDNRAAELSAFVALGAAGFVVNAAAMYLAVGVFQTPLLIGKLLSAGCTFGTNFLLRRHYLFSPAVPARPGNVGTS
jgi:putative flippase GtrA